MLVITKEQLILYIKYRLLQRYIFEYRYRFELCDIEKLI